MENSKIETLDPCFLKRVGNMDLLEEISNKLHLPYNESRYVYHMTTQIIKVVRKYFFYDKFKLGYFTCSSLLTGWDKYANYRLLSDGQEKQFMSKFFEPFENIVEYDGAVYYRHASDFYDNGGNPIYPKGTQGATLHKFMFPHTDYSHSYRGLLDPDNYSYSHDVLDFVNRKLNMAFPGNNLWVVCFDFDYVSIYNLDTLSHMKRY